jgi:hypothetical protein
MVDESMMRQVFCQFGDECDWAMPDGGTLTISVEPRNGAQVRFEDLELEWTTPMKNLCAIPPLFQERNRTPDCPSFIRSSPHITESLVRKSRKGEGSNFCRPENDRKS